MDRLVDNSNQGQRYGPTNTTTAGGTVMEMWMRIWEGKVSVVYEKAVSHLLGLISVGSHPVKHEIW